MKELGEFLKDFQRVQYFLISWKQIPSVANIDSDLVLSNFINIQGKYYQIRLHLLRTDSTLLRQVQCVLQKSNLEQWPDD